MFSKMRFIVMFVTAVWVLFLLILISVKCLCYRTWSTANKLPLNEKRTKALVITGKRLSSTMDFIPEFFIGDTKLTNVSSAKLLGLEIDNALSFSSQVDNLSINCPSVLGYQGRSGVYCHSGNEWCTITVW